MRVRVPMDLRLMKPTSLIRDADLNLRIAGLPAFAGRWSRHGIRGGLPRETGGVFLRRAKRGDRGCAGGEILRRCAPQDDGGTPSASRGSAPPPKGEARAVEKRAGSGEAARYTTKEPLGGSYTKGEKENSGGRSTGVLDSYAGDPRIASMGV